MADTPTDLYAFGPRNKGPRPPRLNVDIFPDVAGIVGPEEVKKAKGASTFGDPKQCSLNGHFFLLPAGTPLPEGLEVVADGSDVDPNSPHGPTHHTLFPGVEMLAEKFVEYFEKLPWKYAGRK